MVSSNYSYSIRICLQTFILFQVVLSNTNKFQTFIWTIHGTLTTITTPGQSEHVSIYLPNLFAMSRMQNKLNIQKG